MILENKDPVHANVTTNLFTLPYVTDDNTTHSSYLCADHETDILIAENIVLRIMGNTSNPLQLESMGAGKNFSKGKFFLYIDKEAVSSSDSTWKLKEVSDCLYTLS